MRGLKYQFRLWRIRRWKRKILKEAGRVITAHFVSKNDALDSLSIAECLAMRYQGDSELSPLSEIVRGIEIYTQNNNISNIHVLTQEDVYREVSPANMMLANFPVGGLCLSEAAMVMTRQRLTEMPSEYGISEDDKREFYNFLNNRKGSILMLPENIVPVIQTLNASSEACSIITAFMIEHERAHMPQQEFDSYEAQDLAETTAAQIRMFAYYNRQAHEVEADYTALTKLGLW